MFFLSAALPLLALTAAASSSQPHKRSYDTHSYYTIELPRSSNEEAAAIAARSLGVELVERVGELDGHWIVRRPGGLSVRSMGQDPVESRFHARRAPGVAAMTRLEPRQRVKRVLSPEHMKLKRGPRSFKNWDMRDQVDPDAAPVVEDNVRDTTELEYLQNTLGFKDPILNQQWHLANPESKEWELNVTGLWTQGITGRNVSVVVVDDGLDHEHEDLKANFFAEGSWDFNDHTNLPTPRLSDDQHGTRCAGEVAAGVNDVCGVGVAYNAKIAGVRILSGSITDADEAAALNYEYQKNDIYSCSWGPPDNGKSMEAPNGIILKSIVNGVQKGRGGKGSLFVFAAGNGGGAGDQCNFDGYTNSIFSVTVGAYDHAGNHPYYSEMCSAMMIVAPSSGSLNYIHTTDRGQGKCAHNHGGTSAAAPLMAGVFALALEVRPDLGWRDVQHLLIRTAVMINPDDEDWDTTAVGRKYSYKYGYGKIDAGLFVEACRDWKLVKPQAWFDSPKILLPYTEAPALPPPPTPAPQQGNDGNGQFIRRQGEDGGAGDNQEGGSDNTPTNTVDVPEPRPNGTFITKEGVSSTYEVTQELLDNENFETLEHVTVRVWIQHERRGDVEVILTSPSGKESVLAKPRRYDEAGTGFNGWKFMTLKHWEENPVGTWTITVKDQGAARGRFVAWALQLWGEAKDASIATDWSPAKAGEIDEELTGSENMPKPSKPKPTDLLPGDHGEVIPEGGHKPSNIPGDNQADEGVFSGMDKLKEHPGWVGGALLIVVLAAMGVGALFFVRNRRRRSRLGLDRAAYVPVAEEVPLGFMERSRQRLGMGRDRRAEEAKELYDAFGDGPSDDDSDDERAALRYHDSFLDDDEPHASGSGTSGKLSHDDDDDGGNKKARDDDEPPAYRDDDEAGTPPAESAGSSGSWQDAALDVRRE